MSDFLMTRFVSVRHSADRVGERHWIRWTREALRTYLTRRALPELTPRELADIGVSASAAVAEAARLPWDSKMGQRGRRAGIIGAIEGILERARSRRLISRMSMRELRDIGLSPSSAQAEAMKPFWQA